MSLGIASESRTTAECPDFSASILATVANTCFTCTSEMLTASLQRKHLARLYWARDTFHPLNTLEKHHGRGRAGQGVRENQAISFCVMAESVSHDKIFNMILQPDPKENGSGVALAAMLVF